MKSIPIQVNELVFPSAREAARYIVGEEAKLGFERKENTIAKELKRCFPKNGEHSWSMYGKWLVKLGPAGAEGDEDYKNITINHCEAWSPLDKRRIDG